MDGEAWVDAEFANIDFGDARLDKPAETVCWAV